MKISFSKVLLTLVLAAACGFYATKTFGEWSANQLECNTIQLPAEALPGAGALRIAFFADLHNHKDHFETCIKEIEAAKPDLIIFGGDFIAVPERFMRSRWAINGLKKLKNIAPIYAILGNHDYEKLEQVERAFDTAGVRILRNEALDWTTPNGSTLRIIGLGDWNEGDEAPQQCMKQAGQESAPVLLISHDPESRWLLRRYDWDLMLSGHTHGGQLGNPFTGEFISFRSSMPAGSYTFEGNRHVFVTRGVGASWNMRFFCPPELNIIDINR